MEDISFRIQPGEHVAIAGASGAGKTTCIQLLLRNWDTEKGCIRIGGKDIRDISLRSLNEMYATVLQDVYLFQVPILENIRLGRSSATDEEVMEAARKAFAHEFITELPDDCRRRRSETIRWSETEDRDSAGISKGFSNSGL